MKMKFTQTGKCPRCIICGAKIYDGVEVYSVPSKTKNANGGYGFVCTAHGVLAKNVSDMPYVSETKKNGFGYRMVVETENKRYPVNVDGVTINSVGNARSFVLTKWKSAQWVSAHYADGVLVSAEYSTLCGFRDNLVSLFKCFNLKHKNSFITFTIRNVIDFFDTDSIMKVNAALIDFGAQTFDGNENELTFFVNPSNLDNIMVQLDVAVKLAELVKKDGEKPFKSAKLIGKVSELLYDAQNGNNIAAIRTQMSGVNRKRNIDRKSLEPAKLK